MAARGLKTLVRDFFRSFDASVSRVPEGLRINLKPSGAEPAEADEAPHEAPDKAPDEAPDKQPDAGAADAPGAKPEIAANADSPEAATESPEAATEAGAAPEAGGEDDDSAVPAAAADAEAVEINRAALAELRELFGRSELTLVFDSKDAIEGADLVVEGGHVLRIIEDFMIHRGTRAYVELPPTARLTKTGLRSHFELGKLDVGDIKREPADAWDVYFTFKLHMRGRTREDELITIRARTRPDQAATVGLADPPAKVAEWPWRVRKQPPSDLVEELHRQACRKAERVALERGVQFRTDSRDGIARDIQRIRAFYSGRIVEQKTNKRSLDKARQRIMDLEDEQERKIKELLTSIRVEVEVETAQVLVVEHPFQRAEVELTGEDRHGVLTITFDRAVGTIITPPCPACEGKLKAVEVCEASHVTCTSCTVDCRCRRRICKSCGWAECGLCEVPTCATCLAECRSCGESTCRKHHADCGRCEDSHCEKCLAPCELCATKICGGCRVGPPDSDGARLCSTCAALCLACERPVPRAELSGCAVCGRRFCGACLDLETGRCAGCLTVDGDSSGKSGRQTDSETDASGADPS